jgi:hypothetical protein
MKVILRFGRTYHLHLQDGRVNQAKPGANRTLEYIITTNISENRIARRFKGYGEVGRTGESNGSKDNVVKGGGSWKLTLWISFRGLSIVYKLHCFRQLYALIYLYAFRPFINLWMGKLQAVSLCSQESLLRGCFELNDTSTVFRKWVMILG